MCESDVVLPQFSSEPWFEPELFRTWPMSGSKFGLQLELNVRFSPRFRQLCILLNPFERVRTHPNWYNIWCRICEFHGVMAITNIYFSLLTYHKHNFLTPVWPNFSRPIENGKPGSRPKLPDVTRCTYPIPFVPQAGRHIPHHENSEAEHHPSYTAYYSAHITGPISVNETIGEPKIRPFLCDLCTSQWNLARISSISGWICLPLQFWCITMVSSHNWRHRGWRHCPYTEVR